MNIDTECASLGMDAVSDRKLPNIINRVQMLHDLAANIDTVSRDVGDRLLGSQPEEGENMKDGMSPMNGDLSQLDICLDLLESNMRRALKSASRLTII